jgi:hypothetical protein
MVSWVAQDSEGLLAIDRPALWVIGSAAVILTSGAVVTASIKPWRDGSMKLSLGTAKFMFVIMLALTATWMVIGFAFTRTPVAQTLYGVCALLSGWSAWANFVTLRNFEAAA